MRIRVWPFRRFVQIFVIVVTLAMPVIARYSHYLSAREFEEFSEKWNGTLQGELLQGVDGVIRTGIPDGEGGVAERHPRKAILERAKGFSGSPWSARLFGISLTDPLAVAESALASRTVRWVLLMGLLLPLVLSVLLGRVFCGWICPMGFFFDMAAKIRTGLDRFLEIRAYNVRISHYGKYFVLAIGLLFAFALGLPILHYIYPPALFGAETHGMVNGLFDRAEQGQFGFAWVGLTSASLFLLGLLLTEIFVAPRFFCRSVCPGGALYSLLGKFRVVRIRREAAGCTHCTLCDKHCPRGLLPMIDRIGGECDNCGVCIDVCAPNVLAYRLSLSDAPILPPGGHGHHTSKTQSPSPPHGTPNGTGGSVGKPEKISTSIRVGSIGLLVFFTILCTSSVEAHHVLGVPHYAYDEDYPQTPVMKLRHDLGRWEVQLTQYPGRPKPGERAQVHAYIMNLATQHVYEGEMTIVVEALKMTGRRDVIHGPSVSHLDENVFKFFFTYPEEGNYEITLGIEDEDGRSTILWPVAIGDPGSPWAILSYFVAGGAVLVLVVRAIRIKRARSHASGLEPSHS